MRKTMLSVWLGTGGNYKGPGWLFSQAPGYLIVEIP
jgi:hypothetical protein